MNKLEGKVALVRERRGESVIERLTTGAPLAEVGWETVYVSGPRGDFDYPAIHSIVSEVFGSWASFMRGI